MDGLVRGTLTLLAFSGMFVCAAKTNWIVALIGLVIALVVIRPAR